MPVNEKVPPLLVPFPEKENENGVWALAGLAPRIIAAAIGKIQAAYFSRWPGRAHAQRIENAFTNDMTIPPPGPVVSRKSGSPSSLHRLTCWCGGVGTALGPRLLKLGRPVSDRSFVARPHCNGLLAP